MKENMLLYAGIIVLGLSVMLNQNNTVILQLGSVSVRANIADSRPELEKGLSGIASLPANTGLWFVFDTSDYHGIWMKDMKFAIDIAWIDDQYRIVHTQHNVAPETYPTVFRPPVPARYVLEVPAGSLLF